MNEIIQSMNTPAYPEDADLEQLRTSIRESLEKTDKGVSLAQSPEARLKPRERELVLDWLGKVSSALKKRAVTILQKVIEKLRHPTMRKTMTEKIREQARPSVRKILEEHRQTIHQNTHRSPPMER